MKNLTKLNGAKALSKKEQKSINGGGQWCYDLIGYPSTNGTSCTTALGNGCCHNGQCVLSDPLCIKRK